VEAAAVEGVEEATTAPVVGAHRRAGRESKPLHREGVEAAVREGVEAAVLGLSSGREWGSLGRSSRRI
jgi:hypothetical protein